MTREIIITGGDSHFFPFMRAAIQSLRAHPISCAYDLGIIDQGLTLEQRAELEALGCQIAIPEWTLPVPAAARQLRNIGLIARTALREYFSGYEVYLWFDADAWMQTPEFIEAFCNGARRHGAAVVAENGPGYRKTFIDTKWWIGNMIAGFGTRAGLRCALATSINIGVLCLTDTAPHWNAWQRWYRVALERTGKVNLDQHAFLAGMLLDALPTAVLPARFNWLPHLSSPVWNSQTRTLCEPTAPYRPLSVIHLAGPRKERPYELRQLDGGRLATPLTYPAMQQLAAA